MIPELGHFALILAAFLGAMFYITVARQKGDRVRTVADYRREKRSA